MKLSDYVQKFDNMEKELQASTVNKLTKDQSNIFRDIFATFRDKNVRYAVLDAPSGTGKTTLIRAMQKWSETNSINIVVTASTGKASSALNGQTIHSFMGMRMVANDTASSKDEALQLSSSKIEFAEDVDILIIDEASMIGKKLFAEIDKAHFNYVLFVLDSSQLPPVKEQKVEWSNVADRQYRLTQTLRAREPRMLKLFEDFREYKLGNIETLDLEDYVNGENIVAIDYKDMDKLPANTESCIVAYRNKLVEHFVEKTTSDDHTMYNLNRGVIVTEMVSTSDTPNEQGFFDRAFKQVSCYYNGEDVEIIKLNEVTQHLVANKVATYNNFRLSINKKETGITIVNTNYKIPYGAKESPEPKFFLGFPKNEILEHCTLVMINKKYFVLMWDKTEDEFEEMLDYYFSKLAPYLKTMRAIKAYRKKPSMDTLHDVPVYLRVNLRNMNSQEFGDWFENQQESTLRKLAWADFLKASSVVSARPTTSRTIHKAQGISIPCVIISDESFFGASKSSQYVAVTRGKHGLVLVKNTPSGWKHNQKEEDEL